MTNNDHFFAFLVFVHRKQGPPRLSVPAFPQEGGMIQDVRDEAIGRQRQKQVAPTSDHWPKLRSHGASTSQLRTPEQQRNQAPQVELRPPFTASRRHHVRPDPEYAPPIDEQSIPGPQPPAGGAQMGEQRRALKQQGGPFPIVQVDPGETGRGRVFRNGLERLMT